MQYPWTFQQNPCPERHNSIIPRHGAYLRLRSDTFSISFQTPRLRKRALLQTHRFRTISRLKCDVLGMRPPRSKFTDETYLRHWTHSLVKQDGLLYNRMIPSTIRSRRPEQLENTS